MPKTYDKITKEQAWTYYVLIGMSAEEISKILEPTAKTILQWAEEGDWESQRTIRLSSPTRIAMDALWMVGNIYKKAREEGRILSSKEIDMVSKHNKMIEKLEKDFTFIASVIEGQGLFMQLLREKDEELFKKVVPINLEYTQELTRKFGES
jgi:hypothetical protein